MEFAIEVLDEFEGKGKNVLAAFAEWRDFKGNDVEAVVKVFTKMAGGNGLLQMGVGCGDEANIDLDGARASQAP